jgi:antitoxin YefM
MVQSIVPIGGRSMKVLSASDDWESLQETIYLQSIPGFVESIREAEQADDWSSEEDFLQALNGMEA